MSLYTKENLLETASAYDGHAAVARDCEKRAREEGRIANAEWCARNAERHTFEAERYRALEPGRYVWSDKAGHLVPED